jgi:hypothetical protein
MAQELNRQAHALSLGSETLQALNQRKRVTNLRLSSGVAGAIHTAAGKKLEE